MTPLDLDALERVAREATQGQWHVDYAEIGPLGSPDTKLVAFVMSEDERYIVVDEEPNATGEEPSPDAAYIAMANPATVLALISRLRASEAARDAAILEMSAQARARGEAEGKLQTAGLPGILEGWIERAKKAEAREREAWIAGRDAVVKLAKQTEEIFDKDFNVSVVNKFDWSENFLEAAQALTPPEGSQ